MDPSSSPSNKKRKPDGDVNGDLLRLFRPPTELTFDDAQEILPSLTRDHLLSILHSALSSSPNFPLLSTIQTIADRNRSFRRLFVAGLAPGTTDAELRHLFYRFGNVQEAIVAASGRGRAGLVTFQCAAAAAAATRSLHDRDVVAVLADPPFPPAAAISPPSPRGVLVRSVSPGFPPDGLLDHFSSYGEMERGKLGFETAGGRFQGSATFVYKTEEGARAAVKEPVKTVGEHVLVCRLAEVESGGRSMLAPISIGTDSSTSSGSIGRPNSGDQSETSPACSDQRHWRDA